MSMDMDVDFVLESLNKGQSAENGLICAARMMEPPARRKLIAELSETQERLTAYAKVIKQSADQITKGLERRPAEWNPVTAGHKVAKLQSETASTLEEVQSQHEAIAKVINQFQALDISADILEKVG